MESKPVMTPEEEDRMIDDAFREVLEGYLKSNHRKKVEIIERAYHFAKEAHKGIRRRSGEPYILHPIAVAKIASQEIGLGSTSICAALLHDVVEDTEITIKDLKKEFPTKVTDAVALLTHDEAVDYFDYVNALKHNDVARKVKLADLDHNSDEKRATGCGLSLEELEAWKEKYAKAKALLL